MADDQERLPQLLAELRSQLAASKSIDDGTRRRLEATLGDVERVLSGGSPSGARSESLTGRLSDTATDFEASHPTLAVTISGLIDALGNLGI
jgi:hypothetical protein